MKRLLILLLLISCTKDEDMRMFTAINNNIVDNLHGIDNTGSTIVTSDIQELIDNNIGTKIILGNSRSDLYLIDQPIVLKTNTDLELNGELFMKGGVTRSLTADLLEGQNIIYVDNSDGAYKIGDRLIITDDAQATAGGGAWKTKKIGQTNVVLSVTSTSVTFENSFTIYHAWNPSYSNNGYYVSQNAVVSHANSCIIIDEEDNVTLTGDFIINGNKANQLNVIGATYDRLVEDLQAQCGISQLSSTNVTIKGSIGNFSIVKDCVMHNMAMNDKTGAGFNTDYLLQYMILDGSGEKNFAVLKLDRYLIDNIINKNGVDEGEIILYNGVSNGTVSNITSINNRRYGVAATGVNNGLNTFTNINVSNNGTGTYDIYIQNQIVGANISNVITSGNGTMAASIVINSSSNINIDDLEITGRVNCGTLLSIGASALSATSEDITITNLDINNSRATYGQAITIIDSVNVLIDQFLVDDVLTCLRDGGNNTNQLFSNGTFSNFGAAYNLDNGTFNFTNTIGIP